MCGERFAPGHGSDAAAPYQAPDAAVTTTPPGRRATRVAGSGTDSAVLVTVCQARPSEDDHAYAGASLLVVNRNFGCGSSREHAPQGIIRRGIRGVVGESFAEIFFSNATALGMPCVTMPQSDVAALQDLIEKAPGISVSVDLARGEVKAGAQTWRSSMPEAAREAFLSGTWDAVSLLLADFDDVRRVADRLPYVTGF